MKLGRPSLIKNPKRVPLTLEADDAKWLKQKARGEGLSLPQYVRRWVKDERGKEKPAAG